MSEDEWIEWSGGDRPVARNQRVIVKHRDGWISGGPVTVADKDWKHAPRGTDARCEDIIAYRVVQP